MVSVYLRQKWFHLFHRVLVVPWELTEAILMHVDRLVLNAFQCYDIDYLSEADEVELASNKDLQDDDTEGS